MLAASTFTNSDFAPSGHRRVADYVESSRKLQAANTLDVRDTINAYRKRLLTNNGFLLSLCMSLERVYLAPGSAQSRDTLVEELRKAKYKSMNDLSTAVEMLVKWCDDNQVVLLDGAIGFFLKD